MCGIFAPPLLKGLATPMSIDFYIIAFNAIFFANNLFYLRLVQRIFAIEYKLSKVLLFSFVSGLSGTLMLILFGSMSALGYFIMLCVYIATIMFFYKEQSWSTKLTCALSFTIHIMFARAIISAVTSIITNRSIYDLSTDITFFWRILILTALLCCCMSLIMTYSIPKRYLQLVGKKTASLKLYIALLLISNIYMIANGNVYIHDINYPWLPLHQIIAAITWLSASYVGIFILVGFDMLRERREKLEKNSIYKHVVESRSIAVLEINCSKNILLSLSRFGKNEPTPTMPYSEYAKFMLRELVCSDDYEEILEHESCANIIDNFNLGKKELAKDCKYIMPDGEIKWIRSKISSHQEITGDIVSIITYMDDIHEAKIKELDLQHKSQIDSLLGAYNKKASENHIKDHLNKNSTGTLFMIDLDNFKGINDNFGHTYGDDVLEEIYNKIAKHFRTGDILGRVGGDEFIAFVKGTMKVDGIEDKAKSICYEVHKNYRENGVEVVVSCSIGIATAPNHGKTFEELYHHADLAMYKCKKTHKNSYAIYDNNTEYNAVTL